jgi:copper resistance protein B
MKTYLAAVILTTLPTPALYAQQQDPHAGHAMPVQADAADPHAGHAPPAGPDAAKPANPHAAHRAPADQQATAPHAGHVMNEAAAVSSDPPVAGPSDAARSGPAHAADAYFGADEMARSRRMLLKENGGLTSAQFLLDRLETSMRNGANGYGWDAQFWYGGDINRIWLKSEGEGALGEGGPEDVEVQALYSHALDPWFNLQAGIRHDFRAGPERTNLVLGIQGLAPYWFEVDGSLFLSDKGEVTARFEAEYDQRITQKLILQPAIEFELSAQDIPELGIGSGLSSAEAGLRLRYQFIPEFAPYAGVQYERRFGTTADFARAAGERAGGWSFLVGLRSWF